jgi:hypothetical protein
MWYSLNMLLKAPFFNNNLYRDSLGIAATDSVMNTESGISRARLKVLMK